MFYAHFDLKTSSLDVLQNILLTIAKKLRVKFFNPCKNALKDTRRSSTFSNMHILQQFEYSGMNPAQYDKF